MGAGRQPPVQGGPARSPAPSGREAEPGFTWHRDKGRTYLWQAVHSTHSQRSRARHPRAQRAEGAAGTCGPMLRSPGPAWGQKMGARAD